MIRFCDQEVCCVNEDEMDRQQIIAYFLNGHRSETVCVLDKEGKFAGTIIYSLILGHELWEAVNREYMILGETTWEEGRRCFERCPVAFGGVAMIPVVDKDRNLLCFAYQDDEANRELRMLDELMEYESAFGFCNVYPQYDHVTVHGCNELAYKFVMYLKKLGVPVHVTGNIWESILNSDIVRSSEECETLDYKNFAIYAEGTKPKEEIIKLRQSVSAEFECVDKIYEKNILEGIINDAERSQKEVLRIFREKPVGLFTGAESVNAYDLLLSYGIDICCFVTENINADKRMMFGKPVVGIKEAKSRWQDIIFIDAEAKNSAWGFGRTDMCCYHGFKRNQRFFLLRDYMEIPPDGFINIMKYKMQKSSGGGQRIVLAGDVWLCLRMRLILELQPEYCGRVVYCDILEKDENKIDGIIQINIKDLKKEDFCLLLFPKYFGCYAERSGTMRYYQQYLEDEYKSKLEKYKITDIIYYSFEDIKFADCMEQSDNIRSELMPDKILLAEINAFSGNEFLEQILESHPDIFILPNSYLRSNLYSLCIRLEMEPSYRILETFWKLYKDEAKYYIDEDKEGIFVKKDIFHKSMLELLEKKDRFTSWELFVIIHISFAKMQGRVIDNISKMIIYWEPHYADPRERYAEWLNNTGRHRFIINMVRNTYLTAGSILTKLHVLDKNKAIRKTERVFMLPNKEKTKYGNWERIVLKFENLKLNSKEELKMFYRRIGIDLPDDFEKWVMNNSNTIFTLSSVYRTWDKYFSAFDYFRICLITGPWQKEYGYPYVESLDYSRNELREIFSKKFQFENGWNFENDESELKYLEWRQKIIGELLWRIRKKEVLGETADGVEQYEIQDCG